MNSTECNSGLTSALFKENEHTIIQILLSTSAITIVIPNSLQVAIIIKTSQIRTTSTYLALNLALCDLSMAIFGLVPSSYILTNRMPCIFEVILNMVRGFFCLFQNVWLLWYHMIDIYISKDQLVIPKSLLPENLESYNHSVSLQQYLWQHYPASTTTLLNSAHQFYCIFQ